MARRVRGGIIVPKPSNVEYAITQYSKAKDKVLYPTGVYLMGTAHTHLSLEYAGVNTKNLGFQLPTDPEFLRDIAAALQMIADDIDEIRS